MFARTLSVALTIAFLAAAPQALAAPLEAEGLSFTSQADVAWEAQSASGFHLYRGDLAALGGNGGACLVGSIQGTTAADAGAPAPDEGFFYLVAAYDEDGEGTLGTGSGGETRPPAPSCIPARRFATLTPDGDPGDGVSDGSEPFRNPSQMVWDGKREAVGAYLHTGEIFLEDTDVSIRGRELDWQLTRSYRSQIAYDGPLGHNWDFNWNMRLGALGSDVLYFDGTGRREVFGRTLGPVFDSPVGRYDVLVENGDGSFTLRTPSGTLFDFHALDGSNVQGSLTRIVDRKNNEITLLYDHQGLLETTVDTLGRRVDFAYRADGRLETVTDFSGRTWTFGYDATGDLVSSTSPSVVEFPSGKTTSYGYSTGFPDPRLNHDLTRVTAPEEQGGGPPLVEIAYETTGPALDLGRVRTWTVGGTNASGSPAGGTSSFSYDYVNGGADPTDRTIPRRITSFSDRAGNDKEYIHNHAGNVLEVTHFTNREVRPGEGDYTTVNVYNVDGEVVSSTNPLGSSYAYVFDNPGLDRFREGNLLEARRIADTVASGGRGDGHGSEAADLVTTYSYDPVYNVRIRETDARGNDPGYVPQNGGTTSPARYRTEWFLDYEEGDPALNGIQDLAARFDIDLSGARSVLGDLNGDGVTTDGRGDVVRRTDPPVTLLPGSHQEGIEGDTAQDIVHTFVYDTFGQKTAETDAEGNRSVYVYHPEDDPDGDGTPSPAPADGRALDPATGGWLASRELDVLTDPARNNGTNPTPAATLHEYEYDPVGNPVRSIDGRGVSTVRVYNELDQLVRIVRAAATADASGPTGEPPTGRGEPGLVAFGYETEYRWDANDNVVRIEIEDRDEDRDVGPTVDERFVYDILDNAILVGREATSTTELVVHFEYDGNENRTAVVAPEGNRHETVYDERDLIFEEVRGASGPFGGTPSVRTHDYDGNENLTGLIDGNGEPIDFGYDGFDRVVRTVDQVGNTTERFYDPVGNVIRELDRGPSGGPTPPDRSGATNVDLSDTFWAYDEMSRVFEERELLFLPVGATTARPPMLAEGAAAPGDGAINTVYEYDALDRLTFRIDDSGAVTTRLYDGLSRVISGMAPEGSPTILTYDGNNNRIEVEAVELASPPGPPDESFLTTYFYDALDRRVLRVDNLGLATYHDWDGLDRPRAVADANGPPGGTVDRRSPGSGGVTVPINAPGNVTRYVYDGADRKVREERILTPSGTGDGTFSPAPDLTLPFNPDGLIIRSWVWDDNSNLEHTVDDAGNTTTFVFDNLSRRVRTVHDDDTQTVRVLDGEDNVLQVTDPNGTVSTHTYDPRWRRIDTAVAPGPGVQGTTVQVFEYDGLHRVTRAEDDDVDVTVVYDSLGRVVEEAQDLSGGAPTLYVSYAWQAQDLMTGLVYPDNRFVQYQYDGAERLRFVVDPGSGAAAGYDYFGVERVHTRFFGNGVRLEIDFDPIRRPAGYRHLDSNDGLIAGFDYSYDGAGNRTSALRLHQPQGPNFVGDVYVFDSANRLVFGEENVFDFNRAPQGVPTDGQFWELDGLGNWAVWDRNGQPFGATPSNMNEYDELQSGGTRIDDGLADDFRDDLFTPFPDGLNLAHDKNGNKTDNGNFELVYDFRNRPVAAIRSADGQTVATYVYDGFDRRVVREVANSGPLDESVRYVHGYCGYDERDLACELEQRDPADNVIRQVVWDGPGSALWQYGPFGDVQYFLGDAQNSIVALIDDNDPPNVQERYVYDPYGRVEIRDAASNPIFVGPTFLPASQFFNDNFYLGLRYDPETGVRTNDQQTDLVGSYSYSGSLYDPNMGRGYTRTLYWWNDYDGAANNPVSFGDYLADPDPGSSTSSAFFYAPGVRDGCYPCCDCGVGSSGGSVEVHAGPDVDDEETTEDDALEREIEAHEAAGDLIGHGNTVATGREAVEKRTAKKEFDRVKKGENARLNKQGKSAKTARGQHGAGKYGPTKQQKKTLQRANQAQETAGKAGKAGKVLDAAGKINRLAETQKKYDKAVEDLDRDLDSIERSEDKYYKKIREIYKNDPKKMKEMIDRTNETMREARKAKEEGATAKAVVAFGEAALETAEDLCPVPGVVDLVKWWVGY